MDKAHRSNLYAAAAHRKYDHVARLRKARKKAMSLMFNKDKLRAMMRELARIVWDGGSLDGADLQVILVKYDILIAVTEIEPCGENCFCRDEYGEDQFPLECFKLAAEWI